MDDIAVLVAQHLDFDVARILDEALDEDAVVAEGGTRFGAGGAHAFRHLVLGARNAHALAAAAGRRLDHHRQADLAHDGEGLRIVRDVAEMAGDGGDAGLPRQLLRFDLVAEHRDGADIRADEGDAGGIQRQREGAALGQEAIAGMDRIGPGLERRIDDPVDHQIGGGSRRRPDIDRLVGHGDVQRLVVGVAIDRNRREPHALRGADDATGDFAAIGDEDLVEHRNSAAPY